MQDFPYLSSILWFPWETTVSCLCGDSVHIPVPQIPPRGGGKKNPLISFVTDLNTEKYEEEHFLPKITVRFEASDDAEEAVDVWSFNVLRCHRKTKNEAANSLGSAVNVTFSRWCSRRGHPVCLCESLRADRHARTLGDPPVHGCRGSYTHLPPGGGGGGGGVC